MYKQLDANEIAAYLKNNPSFFEEHPDLCEQIRLPSNLGGRTVSLQDRQIEMLREKNRALDKKMAEMLYLIKGNSAIEQKFHNWICTLLRARNDVDIPYTLISSLKNSFSIPHVSMRIWGVSENYEHSWFAQNIGEEVKQFAESLKKPYCGENKNFAAVKWLETNDEIQSLALIPLTHPEKNVRGLLIFASPDKERFVADMATDFISRIGETAGAAVSVLLK